MHKTLLSLFIVLLVSFLSGCTNRTVNINPEIEESLLQPEPIDLYGINVNKLVVGKEDLRDQVKEFPFVSLNPVLDYRGKFSDEFYSLKPYKVRSQRIDEVDFWKLQNNPFMVDFIYVLPIWVENFKKVSDDLYQNIGYSYNLSLKEQEILKWWVAQGGVLWLETGIYTTLYDSYTKSGVASATKARRLLNNKSSKLNFMDRNLHVVKYQAKKIDYINYKKREVSFDVESNVKWLSEVNSLRLVVNNYAENYFIPDGSVLLKTAKGMPIITMNKFDKGLVLSMIPFSYNDTRFDGELLRWKLMEYALDETVLKRNQKPILEEVEVVEEMPAKVIPSPVVEKAEPVVVEETKPVIEEVPAPMVVSEEVTEYCIQLYTDGNKESFERILAQHSDLKNIRGETRGQYYVIRAGRYGTIDEAQNDVTQYKKYFYDAFARECSYKK